MPFLRAFGVEQLLEAAGLARALHVGVREQALLDRDARLRRRPGLAGRGAWRLAVRRVELAAGRGGAERRLRVVVVAVGLHRARGGASGRSASCLGHRVVARRPSRGASTCSGCRTRPGAPRSGRASVAADLLDLAVVDRDHRASPRGRRCRSSGRSSLDSTTLAAFWPRLTRLSSSLLGQVVGVARACVDGEAALGEAGERADRSAGTPAIRRARSSTESTYQSAWL